MGAATSYNCNSVWPGLLKLSSHLFRTKHKCGLQDEKTSVAKHLSQCLVTTVYLMEHFKPAGAILYYGISLYHLGILLGVISVLAKQSCNCNKMCSLLTIIQCGEQASQSEEQASSALS